MKFIKWFGFVMAWAPLLLAAQGTPNARIVSLTGSVVLAGPNGDSLPAVVGTELPVGSSVTTAAGGTASVKFFDGTVSIVQPNTNITIETHQKVQETDGIKEETVLDLKSGGVITSLDPAKKSINKFRVRTAKGVAAARGTVFSVRINIDGQSTVATMSGTVTFVTDQGTFTIPVGQISSGGLPQSITDAIANDTTHTLAQDLLDAVTEVARQVGNGNITNTEGSPNLAPNVVEAMAQIAAQLAGNNAAEKSSNIESVIAAAGSNITTDQANQVRETAANPGTGQPTGSTNPILPPLDQTQIIVTPSTTP